MIISFSGTDGSGKTTLINEVKNVLSKTGINTIYRHEYNYIILKYFFKIAGEKKIDMRRKHFLSIKTKKTPIDKLWPYFVLIDAIFLILWLRITKRKTVVILDRFLYDQLVSFEGLGVIKKNDRFIRWLYLNAPSPDIKMILSASPHVAYERKKATHTYPIYFYERGNKNYQEIAERLKIKIVNTDSSLSDTLSEIFSILFNNKKFSNKVINKWANNRIIYKVLNEYNLKELDNHCIKSINEYYGYKVDLLKETLHYINDMLSDEKIEWLLFKSYMPYPYVPTYDVDILVHPSNKKKLISILRKRKILFEEKEIDKINFKLSGKMTISIHLNIGWEGTNYISSDLLWKNIQKISWFGFEIQIPQPEVELLAHIAHIFFEISYIRYSDALYISALSNKKINWHEINKELDRFGWREAYDLVMQCVNLISVDLEKGIKLPYSLPYLKTSFILIKIIRNDVKNKCFSFQKMREYARQIIRYGLWRIGEKVIGRAPFGELLFKMEQ